MKTLASLFLISGVLCAQGTIGSGVTSGQLSFPNISGSVAGSQLQPNTAFGNTALQVCHAQYSFATDGGGSPGLIAPANNCTIPANSTIMNASIRWTTPATGVTNTTSIGVTGTGGGAAVLIGATAVSSLTGQIQSLVVPSVASGWVRITTAGTVTLTTAVAALTGGVCEIYVFYFVSST